MESQGIFNVSSLIFILFYGTTKQYSFRYDGDSGQGLNVVIYQKAWYICVHLQDPAHFLWW